MQSFQTQTDLDLRARLVAEQFPDLAPVHATYLGEGCDSTAFEVNGSWVFRFPKRADVERQLLTELRVLPVLSGRLPLAVPSPCFVGRPTAEFPRHFAGYPKLPGVPGIHVEPDQVPTADLARTLGRFLSALHAFPVDEAQRLDVPDQQIDEVLEECRTDALEGFHLVRAVAPDAPVDGWLAWLSGSAHVTPAHPSARVFVHNDLAAEHVLCDLRTGTPTGVIDWSDMALGDPAADFAALFHWSGDRLAKAVLSHYDGHVDEHGLDRARFMAACRGVGDVRFGLDMNRREYITAGIRALELCAR